MATAMTSNLKVVPSLCKWNYGKCILMDVDQGLNCGGGLRGYGAAQLLLYLFCVLITIFVYLAPGQGMLQTIFVYFC